MLSGKDTAGQPEHIQKCAVLVAKMANLRNVPAEAIVLSWLLKHPAGIVPVLGTTKPHRLAACAKALDVELSREEWYQLFESARGHPMP
jgi:predicted oxidoreductase